MGSNALRERPVRQPNPRKDSKTEAIDLPFYRWNPAGLETKGAGANVGHVVLRRSSRPFNSAVAAGSSEPPRDLIPGARSW